VSVRRVLLQSVCYKHNYCLSICQYNIKIILLFAFFGSLFICLPLWQMNVFTEKRVHYKRGERHGQVNLAAGVTRVRRQQGACLWGLYWCLEAVLCALAAVVERNGARRSLESTARQRAGSARVVWLTDRPAYYSCALAVVLALVYWLMASLSQHEVVDVTLVT